MRFVILMYAEPWGAVQVPHAPWVIKWHTPLHILQPWCVLRMHELGVHERRTGPKSMWRGRPSVVWNTCHSGTIHAHTLLKVQPGIIKRANHSKVGLSHCQRQTSVLRRLQQIGGITRYKICGSGNRRFAMSTGMAIATHRPGLKTRSSKYSQG